MQSIVHEAQCVAGGFLISEPSQRRLDVVDIGCDEQARAQYNDYFCRIDPVAPYLENAAVGRVISSSEVIAPREQRRHEFFNDWATPNDIGNTHFVTLAQSEQCTSAICLASPAASGSACFGSSRVRSTNTARTLLVRLTPHIQNVLNIAANVDARARQAAELTTAFSHIRHGVVLVDDRQRVTFTNAAALDLLHRQKHLLIRRGRLCIPGSLTLQRALTELLGRSLGQSGAIARCGGSLRIRSTQILHPLVLHVAPLGHHDYQLTHTPAAIVLIIDPEQAPAIRAGQLHQLYQLTASESEVALRVAAGRTLQEMAAELQITLSTARIHLQHVFEKTGAHRQADLVRLLVEIGATRSPR